MARIKFLTSMVGAEVSYGAGTEYDVPEDFAAKVADGVRAVRVQAEAREKPKRKRAERAVTPAGDVERATVEG